MKYIKEKAPSVKSKVKQINQKIGKLASKKEDAINKAKEMADSEEPSGKMQASLAKIQLRQSESEAEKLMLQKQAEILKAKIDTAKKKEKTVDDIEEMENKTITIQEGVMSDIHQMIGNHKSFSSFEKEFFKEYGHKKVMKRTPEFLEWLEALYNDSQFVVDEADAKPGPDPYMRGLDDDDEEKKEDKMKKQAEMDDDDPDAYKELPGDKEAKEKGEVKTSKHVKKYHELYGDKKDESVVNEEKAEGDRGKIADANIEKALKTKSEETGVPIGLIRIVMRRGMAAWKTGHRPGATEQQWGYARVNAFLTKGDGTWGGADKDVAKEVRDGGHDKSLKERIESDIRLSDKVVAFKTDDSGFEGQSPNTITCNNCTWTWMKQDGGDDMYVCHKCGTNNAPMLGESILNEEDSYNDYPAAAKKNAKKALDWRDEHGRDEVDAGTAVGWTRANQLAKGEKISADTVKRMASFNRHRKNSSIKPELKGTPWKDKGYVSWLIWGGDEGVDWAMKKSKELDDMKNESKQMKYIKPLNEAEKYITDGFKVGDKIKTNFGEWEVIETDYAPGKSFMAPFIFKGKDMERVNIPNPPKTNKNAIGYKVTDGAKYPTIGFLYQYKDITKLATVGVDESVTENRELMKIDSYLNTKDESVLIDFLDDAYGNSDDRKTRKEWNDARKDLSYNELVDYAVAHAENFGMDLQDIEDAIEVYESVVTEANQLKKGDVVKFKDGRSIHIIGPKGDGYDYKDGREKGHHPKGWFDMMISSGKAIVESVVTEGMSKSLNEAKIKVTKDEWPYLEFKVGSKKHKVEFDYEDIIDDHGNEGQDQYWIGKDDEGQEWMIDVYADYRGEVEEVHYDTIVKESVSSEFSPMGYAKRVVSGAIKIKDAMKEAGISLANMAKLIKRIDKSFDVDAAFLEKNVMQDDPEKFNESVTEGIYAKESKIAPGEYIMTQYGYFYKRVEGKVGGQDAYVEIKKGKEGKRKTSIHDTVDFDIVDKSVALGESVSLKYIKPLNEGYWSSYDYDKWVKDNGRPKYPKWIKSTLKEIVKGGFMDPVYDSEHQYMVLWLASLDNKKRSETYAYDKKGEKELGKVGYAMYKRFYNDLTGYNMFFMQGAMAALEVSKHIQDRVANGEPVEPAYYMMKEYFNNIGMDTKRSRVFNAAYEKLEKWMKDNSIPTL